MSSLAEQYFRSNHQTIQRWLSEDVHHLAGRIGERNMWRSEALAAAQKWLEVRLGEGDLPVRPDIYKVRKYPVANLEVEFLGSTHPDEVIVIGAHYDSVLGCPGADDNASGIAALLALKRLFSSQRRSRTVRFVAFVNEEPPFFLSDEMGSRVYARRCKERGEKIIAMLALETMGYYRSETGSQRLPIGLQWMYPDRGDFLAFVGNRASRNLARDVHRAFVNSCQLPAEWGAFPKWVPAVSFSDHWSFWEEGYSALMVTDTAMYRYPDYHTENDTPEKLDYFRLAEAVVGLHGVLLHLAGLLDRVCPFVPKL